MTCLGAKLTDEDDEMISEGGQLKFVHQVPLSIDGLLLKLGGYNEIVNQEPHPNHLRKTRETKLLRSLKNMPLDREL